MRPFAALAAFLSAACLAAAAPVTSPAEVSAVYRVIHTGFTIGSINENFVRKGDAYGIQSVTRSEGPLKLLLDDQITLESTGRVVPAGLQPLEFTQRRAKDSKRDIKSIFDWDKGVMRTMMRAEPSETPLLPGTQDRLSVMYQFMHLPEYGETITIPLAIVRRVEPWIYKLVGEVRLNTPAGDFDTRHYRRVVSRPDDTKVEVWLAKDRFHFPVRAVFDDPKGFRLEQVIESLQTR
jgi:hypothetical protein